MSSNLWEQLVIPHAAQKTILFLVGLSLLIYEALFYHGSTAPRWPLLMIYGGMMGFPLTLTADERRQSGKEEGE